MPPPSSNTHYGARRGATAVSAPPSYKGLWYKRADGMVFDIRNSVGSGATIDVIRSNNPSLPPGFKVHQQ